MMPGVLIVYLALVASTLYPRGTEPLFFHAGVTLAGAAGLAFAAYRVHRAVAARYLADRLRDPKRAARAYERGTRAGSALILVGYLALVSLGHWPLLVEELLDRTVPFLASETGMAVIDAAIRFLATGFYLAAVLAPVPLALAASWMAQHPAERALRGQDFRAGAFLRFRTRMLAAFGLIPPILLYALFNALSGVPEWQREMEVYPFLTWAGMTVLFLLLSLFFPILLRAGFRSRPLPPGPLRERLDACCTRAGFRCRDLLLWDTCGTHLLNAFIAGLSPRLRYVFFTDALVDRLSPEEVEAVLAHEIGHAACRHLQWYGILTVGFVALSATVLEGASRVFGDNLLPQILAETALLAAYFGGVLGALSRRFETEADLYAARLVGDPLRFAAALRKVIHLSGTPAVRGSWRHPSPARRLAFLAGVAQFPLIETRFLAGLRRLTILLGALVAASLVGAGQAAVSDLAEASARRRRLEDRERAAALWREAERLRHDGRHDDAVERLMLARELAPEHPGLLTRLGDALAAVGKGAEARALYAAAAGAGPRDLRLRQYLAVRTKPPEGR